MIAAIWLIQNWKYTTWKEKNAWELYFFQVWGFKFCLVVSEGLAFGRDASSGRQLEPPKRVSKQNCWLGEKKIVDLTTGRAYIETWSIVRNVSIHGFETTPIISFEIFSRKYENIIVYRKKTYSTPNHHFLILDFTNFAAGFERILVKFAGFSVWPAWCCEIGFYVCHISSLTFIYHSLL